MCLANSKRAALDRLARLAPWTLPANFQLMGRWRDMMVTDGPFSRHFRGICAGVWAGRWRQGAPIAVTSSQLKNARRRHLPTISLSQTLLLPLYLRQRLVPLFLLLRVFFLHNRFSFPAQKYSPAPFSMLYSNFTLYPKGHWHSKDIQPKLALTYPHAHHPPPSPPHTEPVDWGFQQAKPRDPAQFNKLDVKINHDCQYRQYCQWTEFRLIQANLQFQLLSLNDSFCELSHLLRHL